MLIFKLTILNSWILHRNSKELSKHRWRNIAKGQAVELVIFFVCLGLLGFVIYSGHNSHSMGMHWEQVELLPHSQNLRLLQGKLHDYFVVSSNEIALTLPSLTILEVYWLQSHLDLHISCNEQSSIVLLYRSIVVKNMNECINLLSVQFFNKCWFS